MQNGGMRREMSQKRTLMYVHIDETVNGEEMSQTHSFALGVTTIHSA